MIHIVLLFTLITAAFEMCLLMKFATPEWLESSWLLPTGWNSRKLIPKAGVIHMLAIGFNLAVHWGTIVGTMTAITAGLVSFVTVPVTVWVMKNLPKLKTTLGQARQRQVIVRPVTTPTKPSTDTHLSV